MQNLSGGVIEVILLIVIVSFGVGGLADRALRRRRERRGMEQADDHSLRR